MPSFVLVPAPNPAAWHRRVAAALAMAVALLLGGAITPGRAGAEPPPGPVTIGKIAPGTLLHQPILIFRFQFSSGKKGSKSNKPEITFDRNVASIEIPSVVDGQTLIAVTSSVSNF